MKTWEIALIGSGIVIGIIAIAKRKQITDVLMETVWDIYTERRLANLHPSIRERARKFINAADAQGMKLRITSGLRTFHEQQEIYDQGRTKPGKIVTNARPGSSFHNYGLAFDVVEIKDGRGLWENPNWNKIGELGKSFGFAWGGDWSGFKDLPHFEYPPGMTASQLRAWHNEGHTDNDGYLTKIS